MDSTTRQKAAQIQAQFANASNSQENTMDFRGSYNVLVTSKIRMMAHPDFVQEVSYGQQLDKDGNKVPRTLVVIDPKGLPTKFDFNRPFRIADANPGSQKPYMMVTDGTVTVFKKVIGTATLENLPIVDVWTSEDGLGTCSIYGIKDSEGNEYRSSLFVGLLTIKFIDGTEKTRLVMRSSKASISRDRLRYVNEVKGFFEALQNTTKEAAFIIQTPKPLQGEAVLIDLDQLAHFHDEGSFWKNTVKVVKVGTTVEKPESQVPADDTDVDISDLSF